MRAARKRLAMAQYFLSLLYEYGFARGLQCPKRLWLPG